MCSSCQFEEKRSVYQHDYSPCTLRRTVQLVSFGKDSESSMFIICSFINKNKPQNDLWAETHAQLMLSIDYVGEQAAGLELTGLYIFFVFLCTGPPELHRRLEPLRTCTRPIRVGLSKRARTKQLHHHHPYK